MTQKVYRGIFSRKRRKDNDLKLIPLPFNIRECHVDEIVTDRRQNTVIKRRYGLLISEWDKTDFVLLPNGMYGYKELTPDEYLEKEVNCKPMTRSEVEEDVPWDNIRNYEIRGVAHIWNALWWLSEEIERGQKTDSR